MLCRDELLFFAVCATNASPQPPRNTANVIASRLFSGVSHAL